MLSQIAPTVAYPSVAWSTTWREETIVDATAMGMKSEGEALVAETDAMIQKKLAEYPTIEGKKADRKSTRLNSSHNVISRMPSSA